MANTATLRNGWSFEFAADLIEFALSAESTNFSKVLRRIVEEFNAFGCIVWEYVPSDDSGRPNDLTTAPESLFTLAAWFPDAKRFPIHDLPTDGTVSGNALKFNASQKVENVQKEG